MSGIRAHHEWQTESSHTKPYDDSCLPKPPHCPCLVKSNISSTDIHLEKTHARRALQHYLRHYLPEAAVNAKLDLCDELKAKNRLLQAENERLRSSGSAVEKNPVRVHIDEKRIPRTQGELVAADLEEQTHGIKKTFNFPDEIHEDWPLQTPAHQEKAKKTAFGRLSRATKTMLDERARYDEEALDEKMRS